MPETPERRRMARPRRTIDTSTYSGRFAARLRELRDATGMSADAFAEMHGFERSSFYNWESGRRAPSMEFLPKIAGAFGMSVDELLPKE